MNFIEVYPNAKINLGLNIIRKREDGYHDIETIFYPVKGLKDTIKIEINYASDDVQFTAEGLKIDGNSNDNLIIRAVNLLRKEYHIPGLKIELMKSIPFGAGLGGGSADAAFTLNALNELLKLNINPDELEKLAVQIGADCPIFIKNKPVFAEGIGNQFTEIELSLEGYYLCLVKPDIHVSTPEAYSRTTPLIPKKSLKELIKLSPEFWKENIKNDFEDSVFQIYPKIESIKNELYNSGAIYASMSGSGSSVFGIFEKPTQLSSKFPDEFVFECQLD